MGCCVRIENEFQSRIRHAKLKIKALEIKSLTAGSRSNCKPQAGKQVTGNAANE